MKFYSTNNRSLRVNLKEAVLNSLPADGGLYMPEFIPELESSFLERLRDFSFEDISFEISRYYLDEDLSSRDIKSLVEEAINFPAPVIAWDDRFSVLELFHGPSLAFKDFGARFMARLMSRLNEGESNELNILVATSGDTGGAVAAGFYDVPGINVIILYPSGRVSGLQEKQLTTLGKNIRAIEVNGSFDDCQALVKKAFLDRDLNKEIRLSSANSINIARLLPQSFYYFEAFKQCLGISKPISFSIPSGNFGNLTAALMAKKMGLAIQSVIAATNINKVVPIYLESGEFNPMKSIATISNAMDVGNPSNFVRMMDLYDGDLESIKKDVIGSFFTDDETEKAILEVQRNYGYVIDPHGAVGYLAAKAFIDANPGEFCIVVETAHPCKFDQVYKDLHMDYDTPKRVVHLFEKEKKSVRLEVDYEGFREFLLDKR